MDLNDFLAADWLRGESDDSQINQSREEIGAHWGWGADWYSSDGEMTELFGFLDDQAPLHTGDGRTRAMLLDELDGATDESQRASWLSTVEREVFWSVPENRYAAPEYSEPYGMSYRYDRLWEFYEWEDPAQPGVWISQEEADALVTARQQEQPAYYQAADAGVTGTETAEAGAAGTGASGEGAVDWDGFRGQNADFWAGWNGADWATWRAAFTDRLPPELNDEVRPHLNYLDGLDPAGQLTYLRDNLGFTINEEALAYYQSAEVSPAGDSAADTADADADALAVVAPPQEQEAQLATVLPDIADQLSAVVPEEALSDEAGEDAFLDQLAGLFAEENAAAEAGTEAG